MTRINVSAVADRVNTDTRRMCVGSRRQPGAAGRPRPAGPGCRRLVAGYCRVAAGWPPDDRPVPGCGARCEVRLGAGGPVATDLRVLVPGPSHPVVTTSDGPYGDAVFEKNDQFARSATALLIVAVAVLSPAPARATPAAEAPAGPTPADRAWTLGDRSGAATATADTTVTLITGDRVRVTGGQISTEPAKGRERIGFSRWTSNGDTYVVPADAIALTAAGRIDRRLFNITQLVRYGFDDRSRPDLPLIVTRSAGVAARSAARPAPAGTTLVRDLPGAGASAVRAAKADTRTLWTSVSGSPGANTSGPAARALSGGVGRIMLDGPVRAALDNSVPQIGAPAAWAGGHTGKGVTVAVVDSGIDVSHPDLADAVTEAADFTGSPSGADDRYGHGTHVASIVTGSGAAHAAGYRGVAPDATLLNAKVLDDDGIGSESTIIAGMQWAVGHGARVVNVSLGMDFDADGTDLMSREVDRLSAQTGALFVVAAGNNGPRGGTIGSPAAAESALTVGAVDADDRLAYFSARGPRYLDDGVKPDITAPGVGIVAALAHGPVEGPYIAHSGTSMATPHVAGAAAILAGLHPDWAFAQLKAVLVGTAVPTTTASVYEQGAGRVDVARAVAQPVHSSTANLNHGVVAWPHTDDVPVADVIPYVNDGAEPVTLDLAVDVRDPSGEPAPDGMFTVDHDTLTVPAHGSATATVTTNTRVGAPLGVYGGVVTATGPAGIGIRIPIGLDVEAERYDVGVTLRDRDGELSPRYGLRFTDLDTLAEYAPYDPSGRIVARLPKGRYRIDAYVRTPVGGSDFATDTVLATEPQFVVDRDRSFTVDGAAGRPVALGVERPGARIGAAVIGLDSLRGDDTVIGNSWIGDTAGFADVYVVPSTTSAPGTFRFTAEASLAQPSPVGGFRDSPYLYQLRVTTDARVPAGLSRTFADADLATVHTTMSAAAPGRSGVRGLVEIALPGRLTEFYSPAQTWYPDFAQYDAAGRREHLVSSPARTYRRGQVTTQRWNTAVFGPSLPTRPGRNYAAERMFDQLSFGIAMFADGGVNDSGFTSTVTDQWTVLHRGDQVVGRSSAAGQGYFPVPAEEGMYRLHSELRQNGAATSTAIAADWTFPTRPSTGSEVVTLPLLAVRFAPRLDADNRAPAGGPFSFAVSVQRNGAGLVHAGVDLAVEVSYDDGSIWQPATVSRSGHRWSATVEHPAGAGFVSLRATATDTGGYAVTETVTRAYALAEPAQAGG
jgi:subtilisin family serine protease